MIITPLQMYWLTRADMVGYFAVGTSWVIGILACIAALAISIHASDSKTTMKAAMGKIPMKVYKFFAVGFVLSVLTTIFLPTTKELAVIFVVPAIVNNEDVQQIPLDIMKLARQELNKMIDVPKLEGAPK